MIRAIVISVAVTLGASAQAQNLVMKDGKTITAKSLRRQGDQIFATFPLPGDENNTAEIGYPLSAIERLDFPQPAILDAAPGLIAEGKAAEALAQLDPVVSFYISFRDAPGSWWAKAALLKLQALAALKKTQDAESLAGEIIRMPPDPETTHAAQMQLALGMMSKGSKARATDLAERAWKESKVPETRAVASIIRGENFLEKKQWEDALVAFLQIQVFYPQQNALVPKSLLGIGRAYLGMDDFAPSKAALNELIEKHATTPEGEMAKSELAKVARREKALAPAK